jgi:3'(2'), 5'-bisphosphate nucleotidase
MNTEEAKRITSSLIDTFHKAGNLALNLREQGLKKTIKPDNTPVSNGDIEVNKILIKKISELTPNIKIISEENSEHKNDINLKNFWLIDPIDGTRDYINNRDEFTLNAALILNKRPVIGIISAPAKKRIFYSYGDSNSYELINNQQINLTNKEKDYKEIKAVSYSNELKPEILEIHKKYQITSHQKMKSSLKFCVIAASEFDLYVAEPRACEWDIAAGHALVIHSGGKVTDFEGNEIQYGKPGFKNPSIIIKNKKLSNG